MKNKTSHSKTTHKTTVHHSQHRSIKRRRHYSSSDRRSHDIYLNALAKFALSFIDQTAGLLKSGVKFTSETTEKGKQHVKNAAIDLIDGSSRRFHHAIRQSSHLMRKGVQQI